MSWFKRSKPKYKGITSIKQVKTHVREFILDSQIPDGDLVSVDLGCSPISDEVLEREEQESDNRVERIAFLIPLLYGYAALFSEAFVHTLRPPKSITEDPELSKLFDKMTAETKKIFEESMAHLLVGSVSQMIDLGLLQLPKGKK
jgi:hypothetical protein